jgi:hypothetical protein
MDPYTAERLLLERQRRVAQAAETRARQRPEAAQPLRPRVWIAGRLRALADRLEGQPRLQRV